jgi:hypothetical protein
MTTVKVIVTGYKGASYPLQSMSDSVLMTTPCHRQPPGGYPQQAHLDFSDICIRPSRKASCLPLTFTLPQLLLVSEVISTPLIWASSPGSLRSSCTRTRQAHQTPAAPATIAHTHSPAKCRAVPEPPNRARHQPLDDVPHPAPVLRARRPSGRGHRLFAPAGTHLLALQH